MSENGAPAGALSSGAQKKIEPEGRQMGVPLIFSLILNSRRFYITYQKMKEIGPILSKLWPFYDFFGLNTLLTWFCRILIQKRGLYEYT